MVKDLVCGMEVDEKSTPHVSNYMDVAYYFCSAGDKGKFDSNPESYLKGRVESIPKEDAHGQHDALNHKHNQEPPITRPAHEPQSHEEHSVHQGDHHGAHEGHSVEGFKKRFWISLIITVPILILSPMLQHWGGLGDALRFPGDVYLLFAFSSLIFFYGGYPFLKGFIDELIARRPGMMTLIAVAISTAYIYSTVVVFGLKGEIFFWETATLIDIMLLGHWIEMKSVLGASKALEELAKLMPSDAHKIMPDGSMQDIPLGELVAGDRVLVKPGEKIPAR
jgi:P-type Cu2+ transporter